MKTIYDILGTITKDLSQLISNYSKSNLFLDEIPVGHSGISTKDLNEMSKTVSANCYLWMACQSEKTTNPKFLKGTNYKH
jgi:hypothetical protein